MQCLIIILHSPGSCWSSWRSRPEGSKCGCLSTFLDKIQKSVNGIQQLYLRYQCASTDHTPHFLLFWLDVVFMHYVSGKWFFFLFFPVFVLYERLLQNFSVHSKFLSHEFIFFRFSGGARSQRGQRTYRKTRREGQQMCLFPSQLIQTPCQSVADGWTHWHRLCCRRFISGFLLWLCEISAGHHRTRRAPRIYWRDGE